jgi:hypothetical protein
VKNQWCPTLQRHQDVMLMDYFISIKYKYRDLALLNKCRVYLQVLSLTDLTSADGRQIIPHYKQGILSQDRRSTYTWPVQQRPGKEAWSLWNSALQHLESKGMLKTPLGDWLTRPHQNWHWSMDPISSSIFFSSQPDQWYKGKPLISAPKCTTRQALRQLYDISTISPCDPPTQKKFTGHANL